MAQNLDDLCFSANGKLRHEFDEIFAALFGESPGYLKIVQALAKHVGGMTFAELLSETGLSMGGGALRLIDALEQSGFVRRYTAYGKRKYDTQFQLIDNFTLFHFRFLAGESNHDEHFWSHATIGAALNTWRGLAFERLCLQHVPQIKMALGISGVLTKVYAWRHVPDEVYTTGVQIDLLIERADRVVNVCEVKYSSHPFVIDKNYDRQLRSKAGTFADVSKTRSAVHLTMITSNGLSHTGYWGSVQSEVTLDDLFRA